MECRKSIFGVCFGGLRGKHYTHTHIYTSTNLCICICIFLFGHKNNNKTVSAELRLKLCVERNGGGGNNIIYQTETKTSLHYRIPSAVCNITCEPILRIYSTREHHRWGFCVNIASRALSYQNTHGKIIVQNSRRHRLPSKCLKKTPATATEYSACVYTENNAQENV